MLSITTRNLWWSVLIRRDMLRTWNQLFLQQPFCYCEVSQCCPWQPKHRIIGTDLKKVCLESEINGFCNNHFLMLKRLNVVHNAKHYNNRYWIEEVCFESATNSFLHRPSSCGDKSQCCPRQQKPRIIGTNLKRSASNQKPTASAATLFLWWKCQCVALLSMTARA